MIKKTEEKIPKYGADSIKVLNNTKHNTFTELERRIDGVNGGLPRKKREQQDQKSNGGIRTHAGGR